MKQKIYSHLASIYTHLMRSIDYDTWADYIIKLSQQLNTNKIIALELASGTGSLAERVNKYFDFYVCTDLSLEMLKQFSNNTIPRVVCDMTLLPFKNKFNFIFSAFDSVNYLTTKEKLLKLFKEVELCLTNDGIFTFDVSLENNSKRYQRYLNRKGKIDGIRYKQISKYEETKRIHYNIFEIEFENGDKITEIHKQKIYRFEEYFQLLDKSNFYVEHCYDAFTFDDANSESERAQFILRKKSKC
ncbi:class I SAM-dependent DNA methyltransferase [Rosettibacter firmus]|uniref:class I SAM-dependent DNA methyltransferase n=1 Tax=Rosettibacter firmus TaxID=3111522 RepID=UPI00336C2751